MPEATEQQPLSVWEVLAAEYFVLKSIEPDPEYRRAEQEYKQARAARHGAEEGAAADSAYREAERRFRDIVFDRLHAGKRSALCFSGGGIRSATFGLGVLQGLAQLSWSEPGRGEAAAEPKLLAQFDYLSTVSGGGYLGGWFSGWIHRDPNGLTGVVKQLAGTPVEKLEPEPRNVRHLRNFSNYLSPKLGALSADTWTLGATVLRNVLLNWLILLPLLALLLVAPQLINSITGMTPVWPQLLAWFGFACGAAATAYLVCDLPSAGRAGRSQKSFLLGFLTPSALAASSLSLYWAWLRTPHDVWTVIAFTVAMLGMGLIVGAPFAIRSAGDVNWRWVGKSAALTLISGLAAGWLAHQFGTLLRHALSPSDTRWYTLAAFPLALMIIVIAQWILVGLTSRMTDDEDREWWARCCAWWMICAIGWAVFAGIVLFAHQGVLAGWLALKAGVTTLVGTIASRIGFSGNTGSGRRDESKQSAPDPGITGKLMEVAAKLIIPAFLVLLALSLAAANEEIFKLVKLWAPNAGDLQAWLGVAVVLLVPLLVLSPFIDVNKFSLHGMYRSRLIRGFLGASNENRAKDLFSGFDRSDNFWMRDLKPGKPLHVVNTALNLVKGSNLAWQQRKAESFTVSALHCGSCRVGYQNTRTYGGPSGISMGSAITISGAAASPNMGYHSSSMLTIIMTLFNARLGAWLPNPGIAGEGKWSKSGPSYAVRPFIDETFGLTSDDNRWVYLSDGGHFENLGLYEMVLRRCHVIVVSDGSADSGYSFEDLGNAVRKIRVDLGIPIEFSGGIPISAKHEPATRHCTVGRIHYSSVDGPGTPHGTLIYLKASLNGNEPADVAQYATEFSEFPHEPTSDQWFNEAQFESYRRLGAHIIEEIFDWKPRPVTLDEFVDQVTSHLGPKVPSSTA